MIVTRSQLAKCYPQLRQKSVQMFEQITTVHKKFFQELVKYQCDKQMMFKKIMILSEAEETILLDFCVFCEQFSILELGRFAMKMHLQNMQIIKWLIKHLGQFSIKKFPSETNLSVRFKQKENIREIIENKKSVNYYRVKENSKFLAEGIDYELNVIQKQIQGERKNQLQQFQNILKNKQFIERIEASQNQKILFEAVDIISHHSEVFRKLTKNNKQAFIDNYKDLNIKPYSKLKSEIDDAMKEKIQKANHQLINKLDNFLKARNVQVLEQRQIKFKQIGVQINLGQEKNQSEIKNKNQKIKELTVNLNYHKTRSQKLQTLLREKTNHFQQKLIKIRFEKNKQSQFQVLKKSTTQLTSIRNIHIENSKQLGKISEPSSKVNIEHISQNSSSNKTKRTSKRYQRQESLYQKSLMRIQFNLPNQFPSSTPTSDYEQLSAINQDKLSICNEQVIFKYQPSRGVIQLMTRAREYREGCQKKLKFQYNVINQHYKLSGLKYKERNQSLLTITNIRKMGRDGTKNSISLNYRQNIDLQSSNKNIRIQRNSKQRSPLKPKLNEENGKRNLTNQTLQNQDLNNHADLFENDFKIKKMSESNSKMFPLSTDRYRFSNNFEVIHVDSDLFIKNKGRINQMMVQLKKKRRTRQMALKSQNYENIEGRTSLNPQKLLKIYFSEENAMIAELEYGVSVAVLQKNVGQKSKSLNKNEEYIQIMSKKLHKYLSNERKERRKYYFQLQQMIKTPLSYIKGNVKKSNNSILSKDDIINFVRFITNLHESCEDKPCEHFQQFLHDIGMR